LGYGYGGFWTPRRVEQFSSLFDWTFMHSHSAYLETLLNVGVIGLSLGLSVVIGTLISASRSFRMSGDHGYRFVTALLVFALVHGFLDGSFARDGFETFIGALAISMVVFHGATVLVTSWNRPSAAFARGTGFSAFGSLQAGDPYQLETATVYG
jgi:O-antigen ligase